MRGRGRMWGLCSKVLSSSLIRIPLASSLFRSYGFLHSGIGVVGSRGCFGLGF